jgi:hypothetical protein
MESLNSSNPTSKLHPQLILPGDSLIPDSKQTATSLFANDKQLIKEATIVDRWRLANAPFTHLKTRGQMSQPQ